MHIATMAKKFIQSLWDKKERFFGRKEIEELTSSTLSGTSHFSSSSDEENYWASNHKLKSHSILTRQWNKAEQFHTCRARELSVNSLLLVWVAAR